MGSSAGRACSCGPFSVDFTSRDKVDTDEAPTAGIDKNMPPKAERVLHQLGIDAPECIDGTMTRGGPGKSENVYTEAPFSKFQLRGKGYIDKSNTAKVACQDALLELVGCDTFETDAAVRHVAELENSVLKRLQRNAASRGVECPRVLVVNFMTPGSPNINHVQYFAEKPNNHPPDSWCMKILNRFFDNDPSTDQEKLQKFRKDRFKMIPSIVEGNFMVKAAVGTTPCIIGNKIPTEFSSGERHVEVSLDITGSAAAGAILGICKRAAQGLVIDLGYTIECKYEKELPEMLLGAIRLHHIDLTILIELPAYVPVSAEEVKKGKEKFSHE